MHLHVFGLGYLASALEQQRGPNSFTTRASPLCATARALDRTTHLLITAAPGEDGDPCLRQFGAQIAAAKALRWIGYCSTTGVYGDRGGAWVDEATPPAPSEPRSVRRLAAEQGWRALRPDLPLDLFRLGGIYGPGRSVLDDLRAGTARRVVGSAVRFSRIHREDAARAILAAMARPARRGARVLHLVDDTPAESAEVVAFGAALLGVPPPPPIALADAWPGMSAMAQSFWSQSRLVCNRATRRALALAWRYPSYREGLRSILAEEAGQQREVGGA